MKRHALKEQLVIDSVTKRVICVAMSTGWRHDLGLLKVSKTRFAQAVLVKADKGCQGIEQVGGRSETPHEKLRGGQLSEE